MFINGKIYKIDNLFNIFCCLIILKNSNLLNFKKIIKNILKFKPNFF